MYVYVYVYVYVYIYIYIYIYRVGTPAPRTAQEVLMLGFTLPVLTMVLCVTMFSFVPPLTAARLLTARSAWRFPCFPRRRLSTYSPAAQDPPPTEPSV